MPEVELSHAVADLLVLSQPAPSVLSNDDRLLLGALSLTGPALTESTAVTLFGSATVQSLLEEGLAYRAAGGTLAPRPAERRAIEQALEEQPDLGCRLHRLVGDRARAAGRRIAKKERLPLLAHHYREADAIPEAVAAALSLAQFLKTYYRHAEAVECLENLLPRIREEKTRFEVIEALRAAADLAGNQKTALRAAREIARRNPGPETLRQLAYHAVYAGRLTEAQRALDQAVSLHPAGSYLAHLLAYRSYVHFLRRQFEQASIDLERIRNLNLPQGDAALLASVHVSFGNRLIGAADFSGALRHYQEAIRLSRIAKKPQFLIEYLRNAAIPAIYLRSFTAARRFLRLSHRLADTHRDPQNRALLHSVRAMLHFEEGDLRKAYEETVAAARKFGELSMPNRQVEASQNAGYLAFVLDDASAALQWSETAVSLGTYATNTEILVRAQAVRAQVLARRGNFQKAGDLAKEIKEHPACSTSRPARLFHLRADLELKRELGDWSKVDSLARMGQRVALKQKDLTRAAEFLLWSAEAKARTGRTEEALKTLTALRNLSPSLNPLVMTEIHLARLEYSRLLGTPISGHEISRLDRSLKTPRHRFRNLRLKAWAAPSQDSGIRFAYKAYKCLSIVEGRDRYEAAEWLADMLYGAGRSKEAFSHYGEALKMVDDHLSPLPEGIERAGDLTETARRLREKMERCREGVSSVLHDLAAVDEMVRRSARPDQILAHVIGVLAKAIKTPGACIVRASKGRWKTLCSQGLSLADEKRLSSSMRNGEWVRIPLIYRGQESGLLIYRKPEDRLDVEKRSIVEILAMRAAEVLHHDRVSIQALKEQSNRERVKTRQAPRLSAGDEHDDCPEFAGVSASRTEIADQCSRVARTDVNVLLTGETGTGKELLARSIHAAGARGRAPFIVVSCASLSSRLFESELFGHERGAFSGAERSQPGLIRAAEGGTLFLDGVDELNEEGQAALLRVLEERCVRPVGGTKEIKVDFRLICASTRDLAGLVEAGRFRADLRHRIEGVTIRIPPLKERKEDIPLLLNKFGRGKLVFAPSGIGALSRHSWPGNVRELRNFAEAAMMEPARPVDEGVVDRILQQPRKGIGDERERIERTLWTSGTMTEAARRMGCSRKALYSRLKRLGIPVPHRRS